MQIARRLRAMIVNLTETLPAQRHSALRKELELLDRTIEKVYVLPEDLKLASIPDLQGLGGSSHSAELS
jgi:predicted nuclease with RNAse H fold